MKPADGMYDIEFTPIERKWINVHMYLCMKPLHKYTLLQHLIDIGVYHLHFSNRNTQDISESMPKWLDRLVLPSSNKSLILVGGGLHVTRPSRWLWMSRKRELAELKQDQSGRR